MLKDITTTLRLMKYSHNRISYILLAVLFLLIGIVMISVAPTNVGSFVTFIALALLMPLQSIYDFLFSGFIKSSPLSRKMELSVCNIVASLIGLISYIVAIGYSVFLVTSRGYSEATFVPNIIFSGLAVASVLMYFSSCFKYFLASSILFGIFYLVISFTKNLDILVEHAHITIQQATLLGLLFTCIGIIISCIIRVLVYKKAISQKAIGSSLRKHMQ